MTNRKSVVNDNKIEAVPSWFIVPFIRDIIEKLSKLKRAYEDIVLINCENSLECIRILYRVIRSRMLFIKSRVKIAMQVMWDRCVDS